MYLQICTTKNKIKRTDELYNVIPKTNDSTFQYEAPTIPDRHALSSKDKKIINK